MDQPPYGVPSQAGRLPAATHVGAVHLQVSDLERAIGYYRQILGMHVLDQGSDSALLGVPGPGGSLIRLYQKRGIAPAPHGGRFGLFHFAILLPDRAAFGRFAAHVLGMGVRAGMADHAVSEALYLTDPDGLGIEVYADRPRGTWTHRERELVMVTEHLDIAAILAAGEGGTWEGAPIGTVIGHMHLHVGGLGEAEAFYHAALGFDKTVWSYPGALFMSAGGYHHHLAVNVWSAGPSAGADEARLLEWEMIVPTRADADAAARRLRAAGYTADETSDGWRTADSWGTRLHIGAGLRASHRRAEASSSGG